MVKEKFYIPDLKWESYFDVATKKRSRYATTILGMFAIKEVKGEYRLVIPFFPRKGLGIYYYKSVRGAKARAQKMFNQRMRQELVPAPLDPQAPLPTTKDTRYGK